jgi:hypothetical protein
MRRYLTGPDLAAELERLPGLIPVEIDPAERLVHWLDLGKYHCYQGFFDDAITVCAGLRQWTGAGEPEQFTTDIESLHPEQMPPAIARGCLPPSAFIFHACRCGSTLLVKSLARSRQHLTFGEAAPHNQIWTLAEANPDTMAALYRGLMLIMGRRRLPSYQAHIVKFTSFNIVRFERIRRVFPDVPALFLSREPGAILESCERIPPAWLGHSSGTGQTWHTAGSAVEDFFRSALAIRDGRFRHLDYADLTPAALPAILDFFGLPSTPTELRQMQAEFELDAKTSVPVPFVPRSPSVVPVPPRLAALYEQLRDRAALR